MKSEIKKILEEINRDFGENVFLTPDNIRGKISDKTNSKSIRRLLDTAITDMRAYKRLKDAKAKNDFFIVDNLIKEMNEDYGMDLENSKITIYAIAEILGYPALQSSSSTPAQFNKAILKNGLINFGGYEWRILEQNSDRKLLLMEKVLYISPKNDEFIDMTWEGFVLRKKLNSEFYNSIQQPDREKIIKTRIKNPYYNPWYIKSNPYYGDPLYRTANSKDTEDYIFLLSVNEVVRYFGDSGMLKNGEVNRPSDIDFLNLYSVHGIYSSGFNDQYSSVRIAYDDSGVASCWMTRSLGFNSGCVVSVTDNGAIHMHGYGCIETVGVRPACWVNF